MGTETEGNYVRTMGSDLGMTMYRLYCDIAYAHDSFNTFSKLYSSQDTVDVLNRVAPSFFHDHFHILWQSLLLQLCKLTDPASTRGRTNLTLEHLEGFFELEPEFKAGLRVQNQKAFQSCQFARDWRNKRIAHTDKSTALGQSPLLVATVEKLRGALREIAASVNLIEVKYGNGETSYERTIEALGGVDSLIHVLEEWVEKIRDLD